MAIKTSIETYVKGDMYNFVVRNLPADDLAPAICRHKNDQIWIWDISRVSCQKGPNRHAYAWQIGPFWQDTLFIWDCSLLYLACLYRCHSAIMCQGICRHSHNYVPIHPWFYESLFVSHFSHIDGPSQVIQNGQLDFSRSFFMWQMNKFWRIGTSLGLTWGNRFYQIWHVRQQILPIWRLFWPVWLGSAFPACQAVFIHKSPLAINTIISPDKQLCTRPYYSMKGSFWVWVLSLSGYGFSHGEEAWLCNAFSHWPSPYPVWPLLTQSKRSLRTESHADLQSHSAQIMLQRRFFFLYKLFFSYSNWENSRLLYVRIC